MRNERGWSEAVVASTRELTHDVREIEIAPKDGARPWTPGAHIEVLLPSGKSGWIPVAAARPVVTNRMCYAKNSAGEWKIVLFDQAEE